MKKTLLAVCGLMLGINGLALAQANTPVIGRLAPYRPREARSPGEAAPVTRSCVGSKRGARNCILSAPSC